MDEDAHQKRVQIAFTRTMLFWYAETEVRQGHIAQNVESSFQVTKGSDDKGSADRTWTFEDVEKHFSALHTLWESYCLLDRSTRLRDMYKVSRDCAGPSQCGSLSLESRPLRSTSRGKWMCRRWRPCELRQNPRLLPERTLHSLKVWTLDSFENCTVIDPAWCRLLACLNWTK